VFALIVAGIVGITVVILAIIGGTSYFWQTEGITKSRVSDLQKALEAQQARISQLEFKSQGHAWLLQTNGWVRIDGGAQ